MAKTIRDSYGETLAELGQNPQIVVLDADVSSSTKSGLFAAQWPERFFNVGISEANMVGIAAGLAATGKIPFANTFAVFITTLGLLSARAFGSYSGLNIKLMGAYGGLSDAYDGASHHSLEDIAVMRTLPGFTVLVPSDEHMARWVTQHAAQHNGPMYIRLSRDTMPVLYNEGQTFTPGKAQVLRTGEDIAIFACGSMVGHAMQAATRLALESIETRVVDMFSIKPIDKEEILRSAALTGAVVSAEEHSTLGGLGGAVAEVLSAGGAKVRQHFVGMNDCHAESGDYIELCKKYGLDANAVYSAAKQAVAQKQADKKHTTHNS